MILKRFKNFIIESLNNEINYQIKDAYADIEVINDYTWYIVYIESKRKSAGTELMNKIISDAKNKNIKQIKLTAIDSSFGFFKNIGFIEADSNYNPNDIPMVFYI